MKKNFILVLYYWNIIVLLIYTVLIIGSIFSREASQILFRNEDVLTIRLLADIPLLIFWIYCIRLWFIKDKQVKRFLLLFFFSVIYTPFYYKLALKNNWD